jgi:exonuclease SbcC
VHKTVRERLTHLQPFDALYQRQLLPALDGIDEARGRVDALSEQETRREREIAADRIAMDRLAAAIADLPELQAALDRVSSAVDVAAGAERRARQEEGAAMQALDALAAQSEKRTRRMADLAVLNEEISIYNQLREAFGKKGLQAMIIESAIPEIEVEANRLLSRMSDGRMSLRLETLREKVTGGVAETLDIVISDELGGRAYEMYSGGEAFRANLALRIAISKLLARRAGAQLQTLVIDEGFGTQDAQGRQLLVEAISSIQGDFERVLVVTHVEELKDMFPARIDVVKTAAGSRVSIA